MNEQNSRVFDIDLLISIIDKAMTNNFDSPQTNLHIFGNKHVTVDISILYEVAGEDPPFMKVMLQTFIDNMPDTLLKIQKGIEASDWDAVYKAAHFAKSSLSIVKVDKMLELALQIEKLAKTRQNLDQLPRYFSQLSTSFLDAKQVIEEQKLPA